MKFFLIGLLFVTKIVISQTIIPLGSNSTYNFDTIKLMLNDKKNICLGEDAHRIETFSRFKTELIKYLHENLNYNHIAFEGSLLNITNGYYNLKSDTSILRESFFSIWQTQSLLDLVNYISISKKSINQLSISGFDIQVTNSYSSSTWLKTLFLETNPNYSELVYDRDVDLINTCAIIRKSISENKMIGIPNDTLNNFITFYESFSDSIERNKKRLLSTNLLTELQYTLVKHAILDRIRYSKFLAITDVHQSMVFRDSIMAENMNWIINDLYQNEKIIFWAHDDHLSKKTVKRYKKYKLKSSVESLPEETKSKIETISLNFLNNAPREIRIKIKKMNGNVFFVKNPLYLNGTFEYVIYFRNTEAIDKFRIK